MLRRIGNKKKLLHLLDKVFPNNITLFIDMFMGSGEVSLFMAKKGITVIANDIDCDVYNLFMVIRERKAELMEALSSVPLHEKLYANWKKKEEEDDVWRAARFLFRSNFGLYGGMYTFKFGRRSCKKLLLENIIKINPMDIQFMSTDFRNVLGKISIRSENERNKTFVYADPPYLGTHNTYGYRFGKADFVELVELLVKSGLRFCVSEFDNQFVLDVAKSHNLNVKSICERRTIKNKSTEIVITNW